MYFFISRGMSNGREKHTCDGDSAETEAGLDVQDILGLVGGGQDDGIGDEAVFVSLDGADHGCLLLRGLVVVDNTHTT